MSSDEPAVDPAGTPPARRPQVIFIAGSGRSGSTLLERLLGEMTGVVNVGEIIGLFRWAASPGDNRCGCGSVFVDCPFWSEVVERAFGGWESPELARMDALQRKVARQRTLPRLLLAHRREPMATDLARYQDGYVRLYGAVLDVAAADVVVDASKWPAQGLALARSPRLDVRLLHLVRDARGVAFSWAKTGVVRPHDVSGRPTMAVHPVGATAARWTAFQLGAELVGRAVPHYARLRYEDLIAQPTTSTLACLRRLGLARAADALPHLDGRTVTLGTSHGIGGNPSRFRTGPQQLRLDEEWRTAMTRRQRLRVTAVALSVLTRYGYLRRP